MLTTAPQLRSSPGPTGGASGPTVSTQTVASTGWSTAGPRELRPTCWVVPSAVDHCDNQSLGSGKVPDDPAASALVCRWKCLKDGGEFIVATAGAAAAALAGLIIVAMSVHIKTILNIPE